MADLNELNPGSFIDYTGTTGIHPSSPDATKLYGEALTSYRQALAAERGITVEELHISFGHQTLELIDAA